MGLKRPESLWAKEWQTNVQLINATTASQLKVSTCPCYNFKTYHTHSVATCKLVVLTKQPSKAVTGTFSHYQQHYRNSLWLTKEVIHLAYLASLLVGGE